MKLSLNQRRTHAWALLAGLCLFATSACAPARSHEALGSSTQHEEGEEFEETGEEETGDDDFEETGDEETSDEETGDDDFEETGDEETEEPTDDEDTGSDEGQTDEPENPEDPTTGEEPTENPTQDAKEAQKDTPEKQPPKFESELDRRIWNKQNNKASTPLENQRYYNEDGSYYKPDPKQAGVWQKYDSEGTRVGDDVRTIDLPRDGLGRSEIAQDAGPRVWGQWCRAEQADGFQALCAGMGAKVHIRK